METFRVVGVQMARAHIDGSEAGNKMMENFDDAAVNIGVRQ